MNPALRFRGRLRVGHATSIASKLELEYGEQLRLRLLGGDLAWMKHHPFKLRLADLTSYTPDYGVMLPSGELELHEVKGFMETHAAVKLKVAADQFPFRFMLVTKRKKRDGGGWNVVEV